MSGPGWTGRAGAGVAALAVLAVVAAGPWPAHQARAGRPRPAVAAARLVAPSPARAPLLLANLVLYSGSFPAGDGYGPLQVRRAGTGRLISTDMLGFGAVGLAAYGDGRDLVIAKPVGASCVTQLYRLRLSPGGAAGPLRPVGGMLGGAVYSLAVSENGQVIAYTLRGCVKGQPGYLRVLNTRTGRTRQWTGLNIAGISPGRVAIAGLLSMSASGALVAFPAGDTTASGRVTAQVVRVLRTDAARGTVAARSRVVVRGPVAGPNLDGAVLSRDGRSFYLCSVRASRTRLVATVSRRATATGRPERTIATLRASGPVFPQLQLRCPLALDTSGAFLLVPYSVRYPKRPSGPPEIYLARIGLRAGTVRRLVFALPATTGIDEAVSVVMGW